MPLNSIAGQPTNCSDQEYAISTALQVSYKPTNRPDLPLYQNMPTNGIAGYLNILTAQTAGPLPDSIDSTALQVNYYFY